MFGNTILNMMGKKDPTMALLQAMQQGGTSGAPQPAASTPAGVGTDPATAIPAPQPQAYTSPPELVNLYTQLIDRQRKATMIDRGIGLMGASLAFPENRPGILQAFSGEGSSGTSLSSDPMAFVDQLMKMQTAQSALAQKAAHRAALPAIAKQYGLDLQTAQYLFDTGELDGLLSELSKPDNEIVSLEDGTKVIVNKSSGDMSAPFGPPKKREIEIRTDDRGTQFPVYKDTGERVGSGNLVEGQGATENERLWRADEADRAARGLPSRSLSEFVEQIGRSRAGAANLGPNGVDYGNPPKDMAWKRDAEGNIQVDAEGRPMAVPIAGGPIDIEAAAAADKDANKQGQKAVSGSVVSTYTKDILDIMDDSRDNWLLPGPTGWGAMAKWLPETDARTINTALESIKPNLGFEKLQQIRDNSPTGGALGPVSDFENRLLQSTFGGLDQFGSQDAFVRNLMRVDALFNAITNGVPDSDNPGKYRAITTQSEADALMAEADRKAAEFLGGEKAAPKENDVQSLIDKYRSK